MKETILERVFFMAYCKSCGMLMEGDVCPRCGRREGEEIPFERAEELRRKYPNMPAFQGIE